MEFSRIISDAGYFEYFSGSVRSAAIVYVKNGQEYVVKFAGHDVVPREVLDRHKEFLQAIDWTNSDFKLNGLPLPTLNSSHYSAGLLGNKSIALATDLVDVLGMPTHNGSHLRYNEALDEIIREFSARYRSSDFGGMTREAWIAESKMKINGFVAHLKKELADPSSVLKLNSFDVSSPGSSLDMKALLLEKFNPATLEFAPSVVNSHSYRMGAIFGAAALDMTPQPGGLLNVREIRDTSI